MSAARSHPRIVLHLDINKTLVMSDSAGGKSLVNMLNEIIASRTWGQVQPSSTSEITSSSQPFKYQSTENSAYTWTTFSNPPSQTCPIQSKCLGNNVECIPFDQFVEKRLFPYRKARDFHESEHAHKVFAYNRAERKKRKQLLTSFTDKGKPGECVRKYVDELYNKITIPRDRLEACQSYPWFKPGYRYILPAYFKLIEHLVATERDFAIVFRTFGHDLPMVLAEHNLYCSGRHPLYNNRPLNGTLPGRPDLMAKCPENTGRFTRHSGDSDGLYFACVDKVSTDRSRCAHCHQGNDEDDTIELAPLPPVTQQLQGFSQVWNFLQTRIDCGSRVFGIQDYYPFWHENGEEGWAGKLLLVDQNNPDIHHIFFDDNIDEDAASIVHVCDIQSLKPVPFEESKDVYLVKAEPYDIIHNSNYFIERLHDCEIRRKQLLQSEQS